MNFGSDKRARQWRDLAALRALVACRLVSPETHITNINKTDGVGSQIHQTIAVRAFANAIGLPYTHASLMEAAHVAGPEEIARWNELFPLGEGCTTTVSVPLPRMPLHRFLRSPAVWHRPHMLTQVEAHPYLAAHPGAYERVRAAVRASYRGPVTRRQPDEVLAVAIHVRRGDIKPGSSRYTPVKVINERLTAIRASAERRGRAVQATVFSNGQQSELSALHDRGVEVKLGGDPLAAMQAMIAADVLLLAKSSFSYVAGYISRNVVVYQQFGRHPRLQGWQAADTDIDLSAVAHPL